MKPRAATAQKIARLARWFPSGQRLQFGDELEAVLAEHLTAAGDRGWMSLLGAALWELFHLPGLHLRERFYRRTGVTMQGNGIDGLNQTRQPVPWGWALIGALPFLFVLIAVLYGNLVEAIWNQFGASLASDHDSFISWMYNAGYSIALALYIPVLIAGWVRGFPVWFYPFAVQFVILIAISTEYDPYGTNIARLYRLLGQLIPAERAAPGMVILGNLLWLLQFLVPFGIVIGAALFFTRKDRRRPLRDGLTAITQDLTRLSFGIFGLAPLFIPVIWDGLPGPGIFKLLPHVLLGAAALIYLRARRLSMSVAAIVTGFALSYGATIALDMIDWRGAAPVWKTSTAPLEMLSCVLPFFLFVIGPWLIHRYNHRHPADISNRG